MPTFSVFGFSLNCLFTDIYFKNESSNEEPSFNAFTFRILFQLSTLTHYVTIADLDAWKANETFQMPRVLGIEQITSS